MSLTLVQTATTTAASPATATLGASPTAGNVLWVFVSKNDNPSSTAPGVTINGGTALTQVGGTVRAHPTFGGMGWAYYRIVQPGDGTAIVLGATAGNTAMRVSEFSGITGTVPVVTQTATDQSGTTLALSVSPGSGDAVLAGFVTRLRSGGGFFTANGATTQVGSLIYPGGSFNGAQAVGYGTGVIIIGGTQSGSTQDGYYWGGIAVAFAIATPPVAAFTPASGLEAGETVPFTDLSTNTPTSWAWDFGDGSTSTSQNPTHVYATAGTYSVSLTVTNAFGSDSVTHSITIAAADSPVPPEPAGVLLEIYAHAPGSARWDVAKWDQDVWGEGGWQDVTPYGITVDIDWGSRRPELGILSTPDAASWAVDYYDPDRILDPANEEGPYFGDLVPFLPIRVSHRGTIVRVGYASGISHNYASPGAGYMRGADNISILANAQVPSDITLADTLYARAVDAIAAAGLSVTVAAAPLGIDPPVSPWITGTREWSVWDWIKDAAQEVLQVPIIDRLGTLTFRPWASPLTRGRALGSPELIDLAVVTDYSGLYSVVQARQDVSTVIERALTPPPRYGARTYTRDEITIDPDAWADAILADRGLYTFLWKPGDLRPLTALSTETLATIEAVELVTVEYPEANPAIEVSGIVVGGSIHIEGKRDDSAIWRFHYELAQTASQPLTLDGGGPTDYLTTEAGDEYLYPDGSV